MKFLMRKCVLGSHPPVSRSAGEPFFHILTDTVGGWTIGYALRIRGYFRVILLILKEIESRNLMRNGYALAVC